MALTARECWSVSQTPEFQERVRYYLAAKSVEVLAEPLATVGHAARAEYARHILSGGYAIVPACLAIWTNSSLKASGNVNNIETNGVTDAEIQTAIGNMFNALAGVETGT